MLSRRLTMIEHMVKPGVVLADIGTDHAWLPINLIQQGIIERACACDIAAGPLSSAEENIKEAGLKERINTILSNGFDHVPTYCNAAVIAGMGFYTAKDILTRGEKKISSYQQIIVQVNQDSELFRRWLNEKQWKIVDEEIIEDRGFYYEAVSFLVEKGRRLSEEELVLGPILMQKRNPVFLAYAEDQAQKIQQVMQKRNREDEKQKELRQHLAIFENALHQNG